MVLLLSKFGCQKSCMKIAYYKTALRVNKFNNCQAITEHNLLWLTTGEEVAETFGKTVRLEIAETLAETLVKSLFKTLAQDISEMLVETVSWEVAETLVV